ncbi:uncharacterized protein LAESUDRAFT_377342 [Laetiporus sulphureus 93-53]|uniref:Uncharacterized protein n=1 Tax=Laetiporus sulphureus 93-53 TaxID=1314785 RepID=A0A165CPL7_9APHY|nr:uncharacterized protein LAESUDRAFT_377342 [Laetiporus sulphureus 93-53]KZT03188.1 hypothetical protein LAESUDRAFT_377342 [Laetiporus sulphureus 93-53]
MLRPLKGRVFLSASIVCSRDDRMPLNVCAIASHVLSLLFVHGAVRVQVLVGCVLAGGATVPTLTWKNKHIGSFVI